MDTRTEERVDGWDSRSFSGGYDELRSLADRDFSGAVQAGRAWLFMLNGRIVGVFDGVIEDFEDASGTVHTAPDPALPLLFAMKERGGETRAKYYSEDTPISEADRTLSSGSFSGYIELSENVLSGDYYVVYYGGRSMSAAFVGNSEKLLTGEEAFERADDEVGIYEVRDVDIEVTEVPEPETPEPDPDPSPEEGRTVGSAGASGAGAGADTEAGSGPGTGTDTGLGVDPVDDSEPGVAPDRDAGTEAVGSDSVTDGPTSDDAVHGGAGEQEPESTAAENDGLETMEDAQGSTASDPIGSDQPPGGRGATETGAGGGVPEESDREQGGTETGTGTGSRTESRGTDGAEHGGREQAPDAGPNDDTVDRSTGAAGGEPATDRETGPDSPTETPDHRAGTADGSTDAWESADPPTDESGDVVDLDEVSEELDLMMTDPDGESTPTQDREAGGAAERRSGPPSNSRDDPTATDRTAGPRGTEGRDRRSESDERRRTEEPPDQRPGDAGDRHEGSSTDGRSGGSGGPQASGASRPDPEYESEREWRETRTIPSLSPDDSDEGSTGTSPGARATGARNRARSGTGQQQSDRSDDRSSGRRDDTGRRSTRAESHRATGENGHAETDSQSRSPSTTQGSRTGSADDDAGFGPDVLEREDRIDRLKLTIQELESERDDLVDQRDALRRKVESLQSERDDLAERNEELDAQVSRLESRIEELEAENRRLEETLEGIQGAAATASRELTREQALEGTNLFVRYESKGDATLEEAHAGEADAEAVSANIRLEYHTQFDTEDVSVEGMQYDEFLYGTMEYQFVDWVINRLPFEIRESGEAGSVRPLYDALPKVDRAELHGAVDLGTSGEGDAEDDDRPRTHVFDVVLRDRMGEPLAVVELNDSREPATQEMMVALNEAAMATKEAADSLVAAFMVTASFFRPDALETASEATSDSLLSRDSRRSFVKLSRKQGYHLCLVESREGDFHVNVPEL